MTDILPPVRCTGPICRPGLLFQIGTRPMEPAQWLAIGPDHGPFLREKRARLNANPLPFYRTTPGSLPAQIELRDRVVAHLLAHHADVFAMADGRLVDRVEGTAHELDSPGVEPLALISQFLEEDFILLQQVDGQDQITAASNAYSSSGRIVSSVGRSIPWAHKFVPTLNDQLGPRIDRVLGNIKVDAPVERFNWLLTPIASRLFPEDPMRQIRPPSTKSMRRSPKIPAGRAKSCGSGLSGKRFCACRKAGLWLSASTLIPTRFLRLPGIAKAWPRCTA